MLPACIGTHPGILSSMNQFLLRTLNSPFKGYPKYRYKHCSRITYLHLSDLSSALCVRTGCESNF